MKTNNITFPKFTGVRCLMLPYIQGRPETVPAEYRAGYEDILATVFIKAGDKGFLTIDESKATAGTPHRGARAKWARALHTEAGRRGPNAFCWGTADNVTLNPDTRVLLANNLDDSCAIWDTEHAHTSSDGDIGNCAAAYPYTTATLMKRGEVHNIGILTPHESLPVKRDFNRQFLRIMSSGVKGREPYFTVNPLLS